MDNENVILDIETILKENKNKYYSIEEVYNELSKKTSLYNEAQKSIIIVDIKKFLIENNSNNKIKVLIKNGIYYLNYNEENNIKKSIKDKTSIYFFTMFVLTLLFILFDTFPISFFNFNYSVDTSYIFILTFSIISVVFLFLSGYTKNEKYNLKLMAIPITIIYPFFIILSSQIKNFFEIKDFSNMPFDLFLLSLSIIFYVFFRILLGLFKDIYNPLIEKILLIGFYIFILIVLLIKQNIIDGYYSLYYSINEGYCSNLEYEQIIIKDTLYNGKVILDRKLDLYDMNDNIGRFIYEKCD